MEYNLPDIDNLTIIHYPNPTLALDAEEVPEVNDQIVQLARRMVDLMVESDGVGLAAPQVGVSLRLIVVSPTGTKEDAEVFVNPVLTNLIGSCEGEEGCLSVPGVRARVRRAESCTATAQDLDGNSFTIDAAELPAIILQHETDHLDGILFIDRLNAFSKMACRRAIKQLEKEYED